MNIYNGATRLRCWALLGCALPPGLAWPAEPETFLLQASGFENAIVANERGQLIQDWPGRPQLLAPGRWVAVDFETRRSVWFDDAGQVSRRGPYVEIRQGAFERHADDPDRRPLFSTWSKAGTALLFADGSPFVDWQPEQGQWSRTGHPQRYSWRSRDAGERIFDQDGALRLQLLGDEMRAAGPFAGRSDYLVCGMSDGGVCVLRDETGISLQVDGLDAALPLQNGGWLGRQGNAWRLLDRKGQLAGDSTRVYADRGHYLRRREWAGDEVLSWPRWMTEYRVARSSDGSLAVREDSATSGLFQADGTFVPVPGATSAKEVCPGVWRFTLDGGDRLGGPDGQMHTQLDDHAWSEIATRPDLRVSFAENGNETLIDCQGHRVADTPATSHLTADGVGFIGRLAEDGQSRLWLDADLRSHVLSVGNAIETSSPDGALLAVRSQGDDMHFRLYNVKQSRFVGDAFADVQTLQAVGVVFLRDGYYGFMDSHGKERLSPQYSAVIPWGNDRLWSSRYVETGDGSRQQVSLHRIDGTVVGQWWDLTVSTSPESRNLAVNGPVAELSGSTLTTAQGRFFGQQWVDREGTTLFLAVHCQGASIDSQGGVIEPLAGPVRLHGTPCTVPDAIRSGMMKVSSD